MDMTDIVASRASGQRELATLISRFAPADGSHSTAVPGLMLHRHTRPVDLGCGVSRAALVIAAQPKRVIVAGQAYEYDAQNCLITSIDLPILSRVTSASPDAPPVPVADARSAAHRRLAAEMRLPEPDARRRGIALAELTPPLLDAALRLMRLLDTPADIAVVAPLIEKELLYRLMTSGQGTRLRHMAIAGSQTHRIARAIEWIRDHFAEPMRVESLAQAVNMSVSSLHHHFKHVTTLAAAVPEAVTVARGATAAAAAGRRRRVGGRRRRLRKRVAVQPRIQPAVRRAADARRRAVAQEGTARLTADC